jgi:HTH-type transcriptional regulator/antitoxin HigA
MTNIYNPKKYGLLLAATLPAVIETDAENERMTEILNGLMNKGEENLSPEENRLFDLIVRLIEDYERKAHPIEPAPPYLVLQRLMEVRNVRQKDLLHIFGSDGIASEVVNGKRGISKAHAKALAEYFGVSVELFI